MARWLGLAVDPTVGGTTYDDIDGGGITVPDPDLWVPATTGTMTAGSNNLDRNNEVRGRRGNTAPIVFNSDPRGSFEVRAYPRIVQAIVATALGKVGTPTGTSPAAVTTPVTPVESNPLPTLVMHMLREEQYEVITGMAVSSFELNLAADAEGTINLSDGRGLYHDVPQTLPSPLPTPSYRGLNDTFLLRDAVAYIGGDDRTQGVRIPCLSGFTLTYDNNLIDDFQSRFCAGENVRTYSLNGKTYRVWNPGRHKVGPQSVTGTLQFADVRPDLELRRILADAERFEIHCTAGPIAGASPAADETMVITLHQQVLTGGGADPLVKEGDIRASYEFGGFLDPETNDDITIEFVSARPVVVGPIAAGGSGSGSGG